MTRQTDLKKQEWHGHFRKYGKRPEDAAGPLGKKKTQQIQQKIATNKQSLRRTGLKIQARKKSRGKEKEKDWI